MNNAPYDSNEPARYKSFDEMLKRAFEEKKRKRCAVAAAEDSHTLEAVIRAYRDGIAEPVLIGNQEEIIKNIETLGALRRDFEIISLHSKEECALKAVELAAAGHVDFIVKGLLETGTLMKSVVNKGNNLNMGRMLSSVGFLEIPTYHKLLGITDTAINIRPDLNQKKAILENAVDMMRKIGILNPKVALLATVEVVNPKMQDTVDAAELKKLYDLGEIKDCIVEGPISYDLAVSREAALIKGFVSPVAGDADLLVFPELESGNMATKTLLYSGQCKVAAIVSGAKVPIVLTSRSSSSEEKYLSMVLAYLASE